VTISRNALLGWTIAVIDDEPDSLDVAMFVLEYYGAEVITASNGREGLDLIRKHHPRLIISDISMPEMDGWGLIAALKQDAATASIPIIALTAHAMLGDRERVLEAGFNNYLTKPLSPKTFIQDLLTLLVNMSQFTDELKEKIL
jgi:CheY-like chemotaxis protein